MTLKEYVKSLAERIYRIETEGGGGSQGGATKEYVDTKVATATGILQNEINTTNQVVDGNITDISTLQGQMSTAQGDIAQLEIDVDTNTEDIGKNTTAIGNNTQLINQVNGQVEINTADIGTLSGRVTSVETKATNTENLVGNQTDLPDTTKSVALNVAQLNNKINGVGNISVISNGASGTTRITIPSEYITNDYRIEIISYLKYNNTVYKLNYVGLGSDFASDSAVNTQFHAGGYANSSYYWCAEWIIPSATNQIYLNGYFVSGSDQKANAKTYITAEKLHG